MKKRRETQITKWMYEPEIKVAFPVQVGAEFLPQVEELKFL